MKHQISWWRRSGLVAGAHAGRAELNDRGMNAMIFEAPQYGVTVIVARGERAGDLRAAWDVVYQARTSATDNREAVVSQKDEAA